MGSNKQPLFTCVRPTYRTPKNGETYCTVCGVSYLDHA